MTTVPDRTANAGPEPTWPVLLCADDYGIAEGVSRGILELAAAERLSALSAMVTLPRWPGDAPALAGVRARVSVGLHVDLTLGAPLGSMPRLAPQGRLPGIGALVAAALRGAVDAAEIEAETGRQIDAFCAATGHLPDHIDGHQHAHALVGVRTGVLAAIARRYAGAPPPLVRDPADRIGRIAGRGLETMKALGIAALASGFGAAAQARGFPVNAGFAGFSSFDRARPYAEELARAMRRPGPAHMVMCHPGHPDAELGALDPVVARRGDELAAIVGFPDLPGRIWHVARTAGGHVDWSAWMGVRVRAVAGSAP